jgi:hypothetical protein
MSAVKGLAVGIVVVMGIGQPVRGEPMRWGSWRWTSWVAGRGVFQTGLSGAPAFDPFAQAVVPASAPIVPPPAPVVSPPAPVFVPAIPVLPPPSETWQNLGRFAATSPVAAVAPAVLDAPPPLAADAYLNFGVGPYSKADVLTSGGAQPWYNSSVVSRVFGGSPNEQQRADFTNAVLQRVEQTYHQSGLPLTLTDDPNVRAAHTLSIVSHTANSDHPDAIGITSQRSDGFSFIDKFGEAKTLDELETGLAKNVSHELMHAFGVGHHDVTATFLDAPGLPWSILSNPATSFSADAVQDLASKDFRLTSDLLGGLNAETIDGQTIAPQPVPEPATLGLWAASVAGVALARRRSRRPGLDTTRRTLGSCTGLRTESIR